MSERAYEVAHLDDLDRFPVDEEGLPGGRFAAGSASRLSGPTRTPPRRADERVVEEHLEKGGHEELYFVATGHATFTLGDEEMDAPAGTFVYRRARHEARRRRDRAGHDDHRARRQARRAARDLGMGGRCSLAFGKLRNGDEAAGRKEMTRRARRASPTRGRASYNAACFESLTGNREAALEHLRHAIELDPKAKEWAAERQRLRLAPRRPGVPGMSADSSCEHLRPGIRDGAHHDRRWARCGANFGISAFGVNAWTADAAPIRRHQRARRAVGLDSTRSCTSSPTATPMFTINGDEIDAPGRDLRLRARPGRQAPGGREGGRDDGPRRRRESGRGVRALGVGAPSAGDRGTGGPRTGRPRSWSWRELHSEDPDDAMILYNLACAESMAGKREEALGHLRQSVQLDAKFTELAASDSDLDAIRDDPEFAQLSPGRRAPPARARRPGTGSASGRATIKTAP